MVEPVVFGEAVAAAESGSRRLEPAPDGARVRFSDEGADYQTGEAGAQVEPAEGGGTERLDLPLVTDAPVAERIAARRLRRARAERETRTGAAESLRERLVGSRTLVLPDADADVPIGPSLSK